MDDLQNIRHAIEMLLRQGAGARSADVAAAAERYAGACGEMNLRLQRCEEYLARGLCSEAVQLAECPPNLLHVAEALGLADPRAWDALCEIHGQPKPPHPRLDVLERLAAAVEQERRLAPLINRLRVLTLARAAVAERLEVLRALHRENADNDVWTSQLRMLEPARLEELRARADAEGAGKRADAEGIIAAVLAEVEEAEWVTRPDPAWVEALHRRRDELRRAAALGELPAQALAAAFAARDYERCTTLLTEWQAILERHAPLTLPDDARTQIREVSAWVATETRRRTMTDRLRSATASGAPFASPTPPAGVQPPAKPGSRVTGAFRRIVRPRSSDGGEDPPSTER